MTGHSTHCHCISQSASYTFCFHIASYKLHLTDCILHIASYTLPISHYLLHIASYTMQLTQCNLHISSYTLHLTECILHILFSHCILQIASHRLHLAHCLLHIAYFALPLTYCILHNATYTFHLTHCIYLSNLYLRDLWKIDLRNNSSINQLKNFRPQITQYIFLYKPWHQISWLFIIMFYKNSKQNWRQLNILFENYIRKLNW